MFFRNEFCPYLLNVIFTSHARETIVSSEEFFRAQVSADRID